MKNRLGGYPPGAQAQVRDAVDRGGRSTSPFMRAATATRASANSIASSRTGCRDDAPEPCGGREAVRRLCRDGVPVVIDRLTGEIRAHEIFVAVLGASSFTFARATWTQGLADFVDGHVHAFEAIGGVAALLVPDNTRAAVIKACLYDPQINAPMLTWPPLRHGDSSCQTQAPAR